MYHSLSVILVIVHLLLLILIRNKVLFLLQSRLLLLLREYVATLDSHFQHHLLLCQMLLLLLLLSQQLLLLLSLLLLLQLHHKDLLLFRWQLLTILLLSQCWCISVTGSSHLRTSHIFLKIRVWLLHLPLLLLGWIHHYLLLRDHLWVLHPGAFHHIHWRCHLLLRRLLVVVLHLLSSKAIIAGINHLHMSRFRFFLLHIFIFECLPFKVWHDLSMRLVNVRVANHRHLTMTGLSDLWIVNSTVLRRLHILLLLWLFLWRHISG